MNKFLPLGLAGLAIGLASVLFFSNNNQLSAQVLSRATFSDQAVITSSEGALHL
jgi:hypothetical protein